MSEDSSSPQKSFWTTLPGILTGVAGVITAPATLVTSASGLFHVCARSAPKASHSQVAAVANIESESVTPTPSISPPAAAADPKSDACQSHRRPMDVVQRRRG